MNHGYFPEADHEILTERGFYRLRDFERDPMVKIAAYDAATETLVYENIDALIVQPAAERSMVSVEHHLGPWVERETPMPHGEVTNAVSIMTAPGHHLYCAPEGARPKPLVRRRADDVLKATADRHRFLACIKGGVAGGQAWPDELADLAVPPEARAQALELAGMLMARPQSKLEEQLMRCHERVVELVAILGARAHLTTTTADYHTVYALNTMAANLTALAPSAGSLPAWVWRLDAAGARLVVEGMAHMCGSKKQSHDNCYSLVLPSRWQAEQVTRLLLHAGYGVRPTLANYSLHRGFMGRIRLLYHKMGQVAEPVLSRRKDMRQVQTRGRVWGVSVPHGMVVVRRAQRDGNNVVERSSTPVVVGDSSFRI